MAPTIMKGNEAKKSRPGISRKMAKENNMPTKGDRLKKAVARVAPRSRIARTKNANARP